MNRKQFIFLLVMVLVLGAWGLKQLRNQTSSWGGGGATIGKKLLGDFAVNDVAQIAIKRGTNELALAKKNDLWRVVQRGDYPANFAEISGLLLKLKDLKVVQTETVGASQLPRLELGPNGANPPTTVEFRDAGGKAIKTLSLGKKHMKSGGQRSPMEDGGDGGFPDGRYVMAGGAPDQVALISDALANLEPNAGPWLNKEFFKVEKARAITVTFPQSTNSWQLVRETEGGTLKFAEAKPGDELDPSKARGGKRISDQIPATIGQPAAAARENKRNTTLKRNAFYLKYYWLGAVAQQCRIAYATFYWRGVRTSRRRIGGPTRAAIDKKRRLIG